MRTAYLAAAMAILGTSASQAEPTSSRTFQISATVPVVCRVNHGAVAPSSDGMTIALGQIERICNDRTGYRLLLVHDQQLAGSVFEIGGVRTVINGGNETVVFRAFSPQARGDQAVIQLAPGQAMPTNLAFRIEPASGR